MTNITISGPTDVLKASAPIETPHNQTLNVQALNHIVRGLYDFQKVRVGLGNRLCSLLRRRLGQGPSVKASDALDESTIALIEEIRESYKLMGTGVAVEGTAAIEGKAARLMEDDALGEGATGRDEADDERDEATVDPKAAKAAAKLAGINKRLADAVAKAYDKATEKRKNFPTVKQFQPTEIISSYAELQLAAQYLESKRSEEAQIRRLEKTLEEFRIYNEFLEPIKGCGVLMSAVIISTMDPHKAKYVSSFWKYCGLDVVQGTQDGQPWSEGRGKFAHHLVRREFVRKDGTIEIKSSVTFAPDLKTKLVGVLSGCILKAGLKKKDGDDGRVIDYDNCHPYVKVYLDYRHRLENHALYGTQNDKKPDEKRIGRFVFFSEKKNVNPKFTMTSPGRRNRMALRYMIKMFLKDLYIAWRAIEGLEVHPSYQEAKLGHVHGAR